MIIKIIIIYLLRKGRYYKLWPVRLTTHGSSVLYLDFVVGIKFKNKCP